MLDKETFHPLNYIKKEEYSGSMDGMRYLLKKVKSGEDDVIRVTVWPEPLGIYRTPEEKSRDQLYVNFPYTLYNAYLPKCKIFLHFPQYDQIFM